MAKIYDAEMQFLNISYAKNFGLNSEGEVEQFDSDISTRSEVNLRPLLVYSVTVPSYSACYRVLVDPQNPIAISRFLNDAWAPSSWISVPLTLELQSFLLASDLGFIAWARELGIECVKAASTNAIASFSRSAQDLCFPIRWDSESRSQSKPPTLEQANLSLLKYEEFKFGYPGFTSMEGLNFHSWQQRDRKFSNGQWIENDWNLNSLVDKPKPVPPPYLKVSPDPDDSTIYVQGLQELVNMWPGGKVELLRNHGISARHFDLWCSGKSHLPPEDQWSLFADTRVLHRLSYGYYDLQSGYLLVARNKKFTESLYDLLSHGGDLDYSHEVVAPPGSKELPLRVLVFCACGEEPNIFLFPRDSPAKSLLDKLTLINIQAPRVASSQVWENLSMIVENHERFATPAFVGAAFGQKHRSWLYKRLYD